MDDLLQSYMRVKDAGLADRFYEIFLDADPRIRPLFKDTDFTRQKGLLIEGIFVLIQYANGKTVGEMAIERLGETHSKSRMNIPPDLYPIWLKCMLQTLAEKDPEFSPALEAA